MKNPCPKCLVCGDEIYISHYDKKTNKLISPPTCLKCQFVNDFTTTPLTTIQIETIGMIVKKIIKEW